MAQQVQFVYLTQAEYDALEAKDAARLYFTSDTGRIYRGSTTYVPQRVFYGTCSTSLGTAAKVVTCPQFTSSDFVAGTKLIVKFNSTNSNTAPSITIGGSTKRIYRYGTTNPAAYMWHTGQMVEFVYDGTYWLMVNPCPATTTSEGVVKLNDTLTSTSTTEAATANVVKQLNDKFKTDATLTERFSEWDTTTDMTTEFLKILILYGDVGGTTGWYPLVIRGYSAQIDDIDALRLEYAASDSALGVPVVATRQTTQSAWILEYDYEGEYHHIGIYWQDGYGWCIGASNSPYDGAVKGSIDSTDLSWTDDWTGASDSYTLTATRTALQGYVLGTQTDKPLASEAEVEALRTGKADSSHAHGNITSDGALQTTDITIANGDKLVVTDASDSNKVARTSLAFDGSTTTQYLSKKGTWESPPAASTSASGVVQLNNTVTSTLTTQAATANAVKTLNDKFADYVSIADLENGLEVDDIEAKSITIDGVKPSLEGHTHTIQDIEDYEDDIEDRISYSLSTASTLTSGTTQTVELADRANNSATQESGMTTVSLAFPTATSGKARDFILALTCGSTPPNVVFPAGVTIVVDDQTDLTAEEGMNLYSFTEISANTFVVSRLLVSAYSAQ